MKVFHTSTFARSVRKLGLTEAEVAALEADIVLNPEAGDVIKGLGGVRKIRFGFGGRGKRGGGRCVYLVIVVEDSIYLLLAYGKLDQADLTQRQRKAILELVEDLK